MTMRTALITTVFCGTAALLGGCQKTPTELEAAALRDGAGATAPRSAQAVPGTQAGSAANTSVPPANTVMAPATVQPAEPASAGRTNTSMTRAQESSAMPIPGQNNDHSAPLSSTTRPAGPAGRASGP
jgi:hypothetical protein